MPSHGGLYRLYLALAAVGAALPWVLLLDFVAERGFDLPLLLAGPFANAPARMFATDVLFAAWVFLVFVIVEGSRVGVRALWAPVLAVLLAGICCALPLFLALRERALMRAP